MSHTHQRLKASIGRKRTMKSTSRFLRPLRRSARWYAKVTAPWRTTSALDPRFLDAGHKPTSGEDLSHRRLAA